VDFLSQRFRYGWGERLLIRKYRDHPRIGDLVRQTASTSWTRLCRDAGRLAISAVSERSARSLLIALGEIAFYCGGVAGRWGSPSCVARCRQAGSPGGEFPTGSAVLP
jgi:hypothetical protein